MISEEIRLVVDRLKTHGKMIFQDATTEESIINFETEKQVNLPSRYKEWLQFSDGGEFFLPAGIQLYGVNHKPLIDVDDESKPSDDYIIIGALASGDPILCKKNSEKIFIYNQEVGIIEDDEIYDDFITFLNDLYELLGIGD